MENLCDARELPFLKIILISISVLKDFYNFGKCFIDRAGHQSCDCVFHCKLNLPWTMFWCSIIHWSIGIGLDRIWNSWRLGFCSVGWPLSQVVKSSQRQVKSVGSEQSQCQALSSGTMNIHGTTLPVSITEHIVVLIERSSAEIYTSRARSVAMCPRLTPLAL